jgi:DnaD/phage-associated family protein
MPSNYWIKLYHEIIDDPKMAQLPDYLWRRSIELFLLAGDYGEGGLLPPVSDIAWRLRVEEKRLAENLKTLSEIGILTATEQGWLVTRFSQRQKAMSSTERVKRYRKRQRNTDETIRYTDTDKDTDKEPEKDIDIEPDAGGGRPNIFQLYESNIGIITPIISEKLKNAEEDFPDDWIEKACEIAVNNNARNWSYIQAILNRWKRDGFTPNKGDKSDRSSEEARKKYSEWETA